MKNNFFKRITAFTAATVMALGMFTLFPEGSLPHLSLPVSAETTIVENGQCGDNVFYELDSEGTLTISGTGDMWNYSYGYDSSGPGNPFKSFNSPNVIVECGVTSIGSFAFSECINIQSVTLPDSITSIGFAAFHETRIVNISIPDSVTTIGDDAFASCSHLSTVKISSNMNDIGRLFPYCSNLHEIVIPSSVTLIDEEVFFNTSDLYDINIYGYKNSYAETFANENNYEFVEIDCTPDLMGQLGENVYYEYNNDGTLNISGTGAMWGFDGYYTSTSPFYNSDLRDKIKTIAIENGVTTIGDGVFSHCKETTSISIPDSVTYIGVGAFGACTKLTEITIPASVTKFGTRAFGVADWLTLYVYADSCAETYAKENNISYKIVESSDIIDSGQCGNNVFYELDKNGVLTISGSGDMYDYTGNLNGDLSPFFDSENIKQVVVQESVTSIGDFAFFLCDQITSVKLSESLTSIGINGFSNCSSLSSITVPDGLKHIDANAFAYCTSLPTIYIPASVTYIGSNTFKGHQDDFYVTGTEYSTAHIYCDENRITFRSKNNNNNGDTSGSKIYVSKFPSQYIKYQDNEILFEFDESYFAQSSFIMNQKLTQASLALELASWTATDSRNWTEYAYEYNYENFDILNNRDRNLKELFTKMGFDGYMQKKYEKPLSDSSDTVAFGIAHKEIGTGKDKYKLVAVALRGGGYGAEWASNFNVGVDNDYANGFYNASTDVYNSVNSYIEKHKFDKNRVKIWIVGYSRSAAVANITAARLCDDYAEENIYAYTFATPQGYIIDENAVSSKNYRGIHNFVFTGDIVPHVAFTDWGFGRIGNTYYINNVFDQNMRDLYKSLTNESYVYYEQLPDDVHAVVDSLTHVLGVSRFKYYTNLQNALTAALKSANSTHDMMKKETRFETICQVMNTPSVAVGILYNFYKISENVSSALPGTVRFIVGATGMTINVIADNEKSIVNLVSVANMEYILDSHQPEVYAAWIFSTDTNDIYGTAEYKIAVIDCPVDVYVYDKDNNEVAAIVNNQIIKSGVACSILGDQKRVYLSDDTYSIKLVGNGSGTMDYTIEEHDSNGAMTRRVSYYDLPLENGKTYTGKIDNITDTAVDNYNLTGDNGTATSDFDSNTVNTKTYTISVISGTANKISAYPGEQVTVTALVPGKNYEFSHWTSSSASIDNSGMPIATFIMPSADVEIKAVANLISDNNVVSPSRPTVIPSTPTIIVKPNENEEEFYDEDVSSAAGIEANNNDIDDNSNHFLVIFTIISGIIILHK